MSGPSQPIFRFAPSPNGYLHLGHAYSALFTAHWAKEMGGTMLLRIEDIDIARCRPEFAAAIFEDLAWLALSWPEPVRRQSEHFNDYARAAGKLRERGLLYPCFCSRAEIRAAAGEATDPDGAPHYPGICRHLPESERAARLAAGAPVQWRLDMMRAIAVGGPVSVREAMPDPAAPVVTRAADPERWGDVVIVRKDIPTSYHLSVVVDDGLQEVTHVTRGMDLYAATDIHVVLQALLGLFSPTYCHHELVRDETREKLSKSKGSESLRHLREAGWTPDQVQAALGY
jgi:glutamyl-Q tRNA(Asp) synthetase